MGPSTLRKSRREVGWVGVRSCRRRLLTRVIVVNDDCTGERWDHGRRGSAHRGSEMSGMKRERRQRCKMIDDDVD